VHVLNGVVKKNFSSNVWVPRTKQVWVPKANPKGPKQIWVPKLSSSSLNVGEKEGEVDRR